MSAVYDAIVLAGGAGRRLGGVDKAGVEVGGNALLTRVLQAVERANSVVVVGPPRHLPSYVRQIQEEPPGGGPVAAIAAALSTVESTMVAVLACDLPFITRSTVDRLIAALDEGGTEPSSDGAWLVDETGRRQPLAALYRTDSLRRALASCRRLHGSAVHKVTAELTMLDVMAVSDEAADCDTWSDVRRARQRIQQAHLEWT